MATKGGRRPGHWGRLLADKLLQPMVPEFLCGLGKPGTTQFPEAVLLRKPKFFTRARCAHRPRIRTSAMGRVGLLLFGHAEIAACKRTP